MTSNWTYWTTSNTVPAYDDYTLMPTHTGTGLKVEDLLKLWKDDGFEVIKAGEEKEGSRVRRFFGIGKGEELTWELFELRSPYFYDDYGRHACLRLLRNSEGKVLQHEIMNISRRRGEDISGVPVKGVVRDV